MPRRASAPPPRGYAWRRYADGTWWYFAHGTDYPGSTPTFMQAARMWGRRNGYRVQAHQTDRGCSIRFTKNAP